MNRILTMVMLAALSAPASAQDSWESLPDAPQPICLQGAAEVGGIIYMFGGLNPNAMATLYSSTWAYDPSASTWTVKAPMPVAACGMACTVFEGRIYAFGEQLAAMTSPVVRVYDPALDTWSTLGAAMPIEQYMAVCGVIDGKIYLGGGVDSSGGSIRTTQEFNPATGAWRRMADLPIGIGLGGGGVVGKRLYMASGMLEGIDPLPGELSNVCRATFGFDPSDGPTGTWTQLSYMPEGLLYGLWWEASAVIGDSLYLFGGELVLPEDSAYTRALRYEPALDRWTDCATPPEWTAYNAAVSCGGQAYVLGNLYSTMGSNPSRVMRYTPLPSGPTPTVAPVLGSLRQLDAGGKDIPADGTTLFGGEVTFCGKVPDSGPLCRMEIEVKEVGTGVAAPVVKASPMTTDDSFAVALTPAKLGVYSWRARSVDYYGNQGDWIVFPGSFQVVAPPKPKEEEAGGGGGGGSRCGLMGIEPVLILLGIRALRARRIR